MEKSRNDNFELIWLWDVKDIKDGDFSGWLIREYCETRSQGTVRGLVMLNT